MKTAEEIKKGLVLCSADECHGQHTDCPYHPDLMCIRNICADALALIERYESCIARQEENIALLEDAVDKISAQVPRWIPVEERLPEEFATVIIWRNDCKNAAIGWLIGGHWSVPKGVRVTHWMPLPEAPKEDAHEAR